MPQKKKSLLKHKNYQEQPLFKKTSAMPHFEYMLQGITSVEPRTLEE